MILQKLGKYNVCGEMGKTDKGRSKWDNERGGRENKRKMRKET